MQKPRGRGRDYFGHEAKTRHGEKRWKARQESGERLEEEGGEHVICEEKEKKTAKWGRWGWRSRQRVGPGGGINEKIDLSIQRASAVLSLSTHIYSSTWDGFLCCSFLCIWMSAIRMKRQIREEEGGPKLVYRTSSQQWHKYNTQHGWTVLKENEASSHLDELWLRICKPSRTWGQHSKSGIICL